MRPEAGCYRISRFLSSLYFFSGWHFCRGNNHWRAQSSAFFVFYMALPRFWPCLQYMSCSILIPRALALRLRPAFLYMGFCC